MDYPKGTMYSGVVFGMRDPKSGTNTSSSILVPDQIRVRIFDWVRQQGSPCAVISGGEIRGIRGIREWKASRDAEWKDGHPTDFYEDGQQT